MFSLKQFQQVAVEKLVSDVNDLLEYSDDKVCVFKSPTGSGKTIMMAEFLQRLVKDRIDEKEFSFIWISVNQLHNQSKEKLEKYFSSTRILECIEFDDIQDKKIGENEILFLNWQSINKKDNIYIRDNEQDKNLSTIVRNTKDDVREIILIIDESHHTAKAEKSREVIEAIKPKITIEVSATPQIVTDMSRMISVEFQDVRKEGMIKTEVAINPEIDHAKAKKSTDEFIIDIALNKRNELLEQYKKEKIDINPLVLIQLPDNKSGVVDRKDDIISYLKDKHKITTENRKLAIYLSKSDDKINLNNIEKLNNETQVLIFKQAIALGWDCPRASILVLFRDWKSFTFSIQTIGRIMRMPELKHYEAEKLNKGYVYTNLSNVEIAEDIAKDYITIFESKRDGARYENIDLNSIFIKRQRERTRLSGQFSQILLDVADKEKVKSAININPKLKLVNDLLVDGKLIKLDEIQTIKHQGTIKIDLTEKELQYRFDLYIRSVCSPYAPADSSGRIKTALYKLFDKALGISDYVEIQKIILSQDNIQKITDYVNKAKEEYKIKVVEDELEKREIIDSIWNVPLFVSHNSNYVLMNYKKSIMNPHYSKKMSQPEQDFIDLLEDNHNKVKWWFKNGESEIKYFAVKRFDEKGIERAFYVDFIVKMDDGSIGLFDTKGGNTAKGAKSRAEGLQEYINNENKKRKDKLWGGIVVFKDDSCRLNDGKNYDFDESILGDNWKFLNFK